jgi:hypothetical protein
MAYDLLFEGVGDPRGESLSKKDQEHERELDKLVHSSAPLPSHLAAFGRRSSRVDPNVSSNYERMLVF